MWSDLGYEQARDELAEVVRRLEVGRPLVSTTPWRCGSAARRWPAAAKSSSPGPASGCRRCSTRPRTRAAGVVTGRGQDRGADRRRSRQGAELVVGGAAGEHQPHALDVGDPHRLARAACRRRPTARRRRPARPAPGRPPTAAEQRLLGGVALLELQVARGRREVARRGPPSGRATTSVPTEFDRQPARRRGHPHGNGTDAREPRSCAGASTTRAADGSDAGPPGVNDAPLDRKPSTSTTSTQHAHGGDHVPDGHRRARGLRPTAHPRVHHPSPGARPDLRGSEAERRRPPCPRRTAAARPPTATSPWSWCGSPRPRRWRRAAGSGAATRTAATARRSTRCASSSARVSMRGVVVIGEGEKDEAPMLFNGEEVGNGWGPRLRRRGRPDRRHHADGQGHARTRSPCSRSPSGARCTTRPRCSTWRSWPSGRRRPTPSTSPLPVGREHPPGRGGEGASRSTTSRCACSTGRGTPTWSQEIRRTGARIQFISDGDVAGAISAARPNTGVDLLSASAAPPRGSSRRPR